MSNRAIATMAIVGVVIVIIIIAAVAGVLLLGKSTTTSSTSTTSSSSSSSSIIPPSTTSSSSSSSSSSTSISSSSSSQSSNSGDVAAVQAQLTTWVSDFNSRNVEALGNFYTGTSVDNWTGHAQGLQGIYPGVSNIRILYGSSISHTDRLTANISNINAVESTPGNVTVTFNLSLNGHSTVVGNLSASIAVTQDWVNSGGTWTIQHEVWNYLSFTTTNPGTATVFPQWGLSLEGKSPNLASEHVLEWNAAPYVAAAIYGSIIAIFVLALMVRARRQKK
jgi:hypothetical protein